MASEMETDYSLRTEAFPKSQRVVPSGQMLRLDSQAGWLDD
jgi:hypothetical protein